MKPIKPVYIIACGALAREIQMLIRLNHWDHFVVDYLPAEFHNTPQKIPGKIREKLSQAHQRYERIFVAYADCGTGGLLDPILQEFGGERLPGAHCYEFFAGSTLFNQLIEQEIGSFYLTDFLAQNFERLIIRGLGIDCHPELQDLYFGNYKKLVYLAQTENPRLLTKAEQAAQKLNLVFEHHQTGYGDLQTALMKL